MSKDNKTNLKAHHKANNRKQIDKRGLLTEFVIFIVLVAGMGLLLSLIACQPVQAKQIATAMTGYGKEVAQ